MKLTDEQIENIKQSLEFNAVWWSDVQEGEPIAQDEIDEVKEVLAHNRQLMADRQAWKEEALQHRKRWQEEIETSEQVVQEREELIIENERLQEQLKGIGVEEYLTLQRKHFETQSQLRQAVEVLKQIANQSTQQRNYSVGLDRCIELADDFLSSLSEGGKP